MKSTLLALITLVLLQPLIACSSANKLAGSSSENVVKGARDSITDTGTGSQTGGNMGSPPSAITLPGGGSPANAQKSSSKPDGPSSENVVKGARDSITDTGTGSQTGGNVPDPAIITELNSADPALKK